MTENTGSGILSGSISHPGRGPEGEMREKKGFFEKPKENGILANIIKMLSSFFRSIQTNVPYTDVLRCGCHPGHGTTWPKCDRS